MSAAVPATDLANPFEEFKLLMGDLATKGPLISMQVANAWLEDAQLQTTAQMHLSRAFGRIILGLLRNPSFVARSQLELTRQSMELFAHSARRLMGDDSPLRPGRKRDRRFRNPGWQSAVFDVLRESYLVLTDWLQETVENIDCGDERTQEIVSFYTKQFADAVSPSNFVLTNPEVLRVTHQTGGANILRGMRNMLEDLERGHGRLAIRRTDLNAFTVGENLANTEGQVVFENDLMQLIQYAPLTKMVHRRPLLVVPPWINKYYILDLQPKNSFVRWATEQGFTVFIISWVNPDENLAQKSFEHYLQEGPLAAIDAIGEATGEKDITAVGYCLGGTLLTTALAHLAAKGDDRVKAATFLTTLVDFSEPGDLGVYIDDKQVKMIEREMDHLGYLDARKMQLSFNMLRANELIWSYIVNNYLLGRDPFPFDLLYWNADSTRMPAAMHSYYLRRMYLENKLVEPGGLELAGTPIDLGKVTIPTYHLSCNDDHIAPWWSTYAATQHFAGERRMVLSGSGHIAGVVNPPTSNKYGYWTNAELPTDPQDWFEGAQLHPGSWWPNWAEWNAKQSGPRNVPARVVGKGKLKVIENAPGRYCRNG